MGGIVSFHGQDHGRNRNASMLNDVEYGEEVSQSQKAAEASYISQDTLNSILDDSNRVHDDDISSVGMATNRPEDVGSRKEEEKGKVFFRKGKGFGNR